MKCSQHPIFLLLLLAVVAYSCNKSDDSLPNSGGSSDSNWQVPKKDVFDGGPGKDGIPALENPKTIDVASANKFRSRKLVVAYKSGEEAVAFPHSVMEHHEIANVTIGNQPIAITYCPLTGTSIGWDREVNGQLTTFGVSGLLFNDNLIPYDRLTNSNYSQILMKSISGDKAGTEVKTYHVVETTWETWKKMYPNAKVLSTDTDFNFDYAQSLYGDYRSTSELLFPVQNEDDRYHRKKRLLGVILDNSLKVYKLSDFSKSVQVIQDQFMNTDLVVAGSNEAGDNFAVAFNRNLDGQKLNFTAVKDELPVIMEDDKGNRWDVFGKAVKGPDQGAKLQHPQSYIGFWFAWAAFFPNLEVYQN